MNEVLSHPMELTITIDGALYAAYREKLGGQHIDAAKVIANMVNVHMQELCGDDDLN